MSAGCWLSSCWSTLDLPNYLIVRSSWATACFLILKMRKLTQKNLVHRMSSHQLSLQSLKLQWKLGGLNFGCHTALLCIPKCGIPFYQKLFCFIYLSIKWGNIPQEHSLKAILRRCKYVPAQGTWLGQKRLWQVSPSLTLQTLEI